MPTHTSADELTRSRLCGAAMVGDYKGVIEMAEQYEPVGNPSHYTQGSIECIDALREILTKEEFRGFVRGNMIKYGWRASLKGAEAQDAAKAAVYARWWAESFSEQPE